MVALFASGFKLALTLGHKEVSRLVTTGSLAHPFSPNQLCVCVCTYVYVHDCVHVCMCVRMRERERSGGERER